MFPALGIPELAWRDWSHKGSLATQREHPSQLYRQREQNERRPGKTECKHLRVRT